MSSRQAKNGKLKPFRPRYHVGGLCNATWHTCRRLNRASGIHVGQLLGWAPQIIHFNRVFHCKPSILWYPYIWKYPYILVAKRKQYGLVSFAFQALTGVFVERWWKMAMIFAPSVSPSAGWNWQNMSPKCSDLTSDGGAMDEQNQSKSGCPMVDKVDIVDIQQNKLCLSPQIQHSSFRLCMILSYHLQTCWLNRQSCCIPWQSCSALPIWPVCLSAAQSCKVGPKN